MEEKTVYQTDAAGFFLYRTTAHELFLSPGEFNVPYGAVEAEPPAANDGSVPKWDGEKWMIVEDHRQKSLYVVATGAAYTLGDTVELNSESVTYDGGGPIPAWLTLDAPAPTNQLLGTD
ncbi:phage tail protein [Pandoraea pnomenusa]|uniref:phage tail protein n=1 Tax=Pandoraea pnomenusa TaxID=93220 RepID=UPI00334060B8